MPFEVSTSMSASFGSEILWKSLYYRQLTKIIVFFGICISAIGAADRQTVRTLVHQDADPARSDPDHRSDKPRNEILSGADRRRRYERSAQAVQGGGCPARAQGLGYQPADGLAAVLIVVIGINRPLVRDAFVALNASDPLLKGLLHFVGSSSPLVVKVHRLIAMAIATFARIGMLHGSPDIAG